MNSNIKMIENKNLGVFAEIYLNEPITFLKNDYEGIGSIRFLESSQVEKMMGDERMSSEE